MHLPLLLSIMLGSVLAQANIESACTTRYGTFAVENLQTSKQSFTTTKTFTKLVNVTPVTTVTPPIDTSTISFTQIFTSWLLMPAITDRYTISHITTVTQTIPSIQTHTHTKTTTSTTTVSSTATVPTPANHTALAFQQGTFLKRNAVLVERQPLRAGTPDSIKALPPIVPRSNNMKRAGSLAQAPKRNKQVISQYASSVLCHVTITRYQTVTISTTGKSTVTKTAPAQTSFATITYKSAITSTSIIAEFTITIAVPVTSSVTTVSTSSTATTITHTQTVLAPSTTYFPQCAPGNLVSSIAGKKIGSIYFNKTLVLQSLYPSDATGYGCCIICATSSICVGFAQHPGGVCYYVTADGHGDAKSWGSMFHYSDTESDGYMIGNGPSSFSKPNSE